MVDPASTAAATAAAVEAIKFTAGQVAAAKKKKKKKKRLRRQQAALDSAMDYMPGQSQEELKARAREAYRRSMAESERGKGIDFTRARRR